MTLQRKLWILSIVVVFSLVCSTAASWMRTHHFDTGVWIVGLLIFAQLQVPKSKKRAIPVTLILLGGFAIYQTITKDASSFPLRALDITLSTITIVASALILKTIASSTEAQSVKICWGNVVLLNVLSPFYGILMISALATPLAIAYQHLAPQLFFTRAPQLIMIAILVLVYTATFNGWMPFTKGRRLSRPKNPEPVEPTSEPAPVPKFRTRFVFDTVFLASIIFFGARTWYRSGLLQMKMGMDPFEVMGDQKIPRSKSFPGCPDGTTFTNRWESPGYAEWCADPEGRRSGPYLAWYQENKKAAEGKYESGHRVGAWHGWDYEGKSLYEGAYENGRRSGDWVFHRAAGPITVRYAPDEDCVSRWAAQRWVIAPGHCVGPVSPSTSIQDAFNAFGNAGVEQSQYVLSISYEKSNSFVLSYLGDEPNDFNASVSTQTAWHTPGGIRLNQTLADLEKKNGRPLSLGRNGGSAQVLNWNGGTLESEGLFLQITLSPARKPPKGPAMSKKIEEDEEYEEFDEEVGGPEVVSSDDPSIDKKACRVMALTARFMPTDPEAEFEKQQSSMGEYHSVAASTTGASMFLLRQRELRAVQVDSGQTLWTASGTWSGIGARLLADGENAVVQKMNVITMLDGSTGGVLWTRPGRALGEAILYERLLSHANLLFIEHGIKEPRLDAVDRATGQVRWSVPGQIQTPRGGTLQNGRLILQTKDKVTVHDASTGKALFSMSTAASKKPASKKSALTYVRRERALGVVGNTLVMSKGKNSVRAVGFNGKEKWIHVSKLPGTYISVLRAGGKQALLVSIVPGSKPRQHLEMLDAATGRSLWNSEYQFSQRMEPWIDESSVLIQEGADFIRCKDIPTGRERWSHKLSPEPGFGLLLTELVVTSKLVLVPAKTGVVTALDRTTGKMAWRFETSINDWPSLLASSPNERYIWIGTSDGTLYSVDPSGRLISKISTGQSSAVQPVTVGASTAVLRTPTGYEGRDISSAEVTWSLTVSSSGFTGPTLAAKTPKAL